MIILGLQPVETSVSDERCMGPIIWCDDEVDHAGVGSACQAADGDDGTLRWVNAAKAAVLLHALEDFGDERWIESVFPT